MCFGTACNPCWLAVALCVQAALRSASLVAATVVGVAFGNWLLALMGRKVWGDCAMGVL